MLNVFALVVFPCHFQSHTKLIGPESFLKSRTQIGSMNQNDHRRGRVKKTSVLIVRHERFHFQQTAIVAMEPDSEPDIDTDMDSVTMCTESSSEPSTANFTRTSVSSDQMLDSEMRE